MITRNVDTENGICNGTLCQLAKIIFKDPSEIKYWNMIGSVVVPWTYASYVKFLVFKHLDKHLKKKVYYKDIPGFLSIKPTSATVDCDWKTNHVIKGYTKQFPCVPAFPITGHKVQGATLKNIVVASWKRHSSGMTGWLYVVLSRVKSLSNPFVLDPFPMDLKLYRPRPGGDGRIKYSLPHIIR